MGQSARSAPLTSPNRLRTQISLDKKEYDLAKMQAAALGISIAEFIRRAVREQLPVRGEGAWMRYAGFVATARTPANRSTISSMARRTEHRRDDKAPRRMAFVEAYVDTSALIAFLDKSDSYHLTFKRLFSEPPALVTSALVIAEGHGWFLRRYDRHRAAEFLAFL